MICRTIIIAILLMLGTRTFAQSDYDVLTDKENGSTVFKGQCTFDDLKKETSFSWLAKKSEAYKPDTEAIKYLKKNLPKYNIVVLMGTWCDDTKTLLPAFYKVLQQTNYPMDKLLMYGADRGKQTKYVEYRLYKLKELPTFIVIKNNTEIGRIVETVHKNIETDLIAIIQKDLDQEPGQ